jgi:hypothetical protein
MRSMVEGAGRERRALALFPLHPPSGGPLPLRVRRAFEILEDI